jgi:hypothetical protein
LEDAKTQQIAKLFRLQNERKRFEMNRSLEKLIHERQRQNITNRSGFAFSFATAHTIPALSL